jgi:aminoglycoside phosphotransferase (APT) family kinase protein
MNDADEKPDRQLALRLVTTLFPGSTLLDLWRLTGGVSAQTSVIEIQHVDGTRRRLVLRSHGENDLQRDPDIAQHEFELLQVLSQHGIPVAPPVFVDKTGDLYGQPVIVVEFVEGETRTSADPVPSDQSIQEMAYWLARIHRLDLTAFDLSFLIARDYRSEDRLARKPDDSGLVEVIRSALLDAGPEPSGNSPALLHGDYWPGNLLWNGDQIVAIIDWEDALIDDPIIDLARTRLELFCAYGEGPCEQFTSRYLEYNPLNIDALARWDLNASLDFARAFTKWRLPSDQELAMKQSLERFVARAIERLKR